jgi:hypothetical protein
VNPQQRRIGAVEYLLLVGLGRECSHCSSAYGAGGS